MKEKFAFQTFSTLFIQMIGFFLLLLKRSSIDVELYAIMSWSRVFTGFFTMFLDLGVSAIHFTYSPNPKFKTYFGTYFIVKIALITFNYALPFVYLIFFSDTGLTNQLADPLTRQLVTLNLFIGISQQLSEVFRMNLQIKLKIMKREIPNIICLLISYTLQAIVCFNIDNYDSPAIIIFRIILYTSFFQLLIYFIININESIFHPVDMQLFKQYFIDAKPLIFQSIVSISSTYIGLLILGNESGIIELNYYDFVSSYLVNILVFFSMSSTGIFNSIFPGFFATKDYQSIQSYQNKFEKYASIFYIMVIVVIQLISLPSFNLFLPAYIPSVKYLRFLIFIPFLDAINRPYLGNMIQSKNQAISARIGIFCIIISLVLQIIFVSNVFLGLGAWGLIIVRFILIFINNILYRYFSYKKFGLKSGVKYLKHFISGVLAFVFPFLVFMLFQKALAAHLIYEILFKSILSVATYLLILILFKEISKKDYDFFKELIMPSTYINSLKVEMQNEKKKKKEE